MKPAYSAEIAQLRSELRELRLENAALVRENSRLITLVEQGVAVSDRMKLDLILSGALSIPQKKEPTMQNPTPEDLIVIRKELAYTMRELARELDSPRPTAELVPSISELHVGLGMLLGAEARAAELTPPNGNAVPLAAHK